MVYRIYDLNIKIISGYKKEEVERDYNNFTTANKGKCVSSQSHFQIDNGTILYCIIIYYQK